MTIFTMTAFSNSSLGLGAYDILPSGGIHTATGLGQTVLVIDEDPIFDDEQSSSGQTLDVTSQVLANSFGVVNAGQVIQSVYKWAVTNTTTGQSGWGYLLRVYNSTDPANPGYSQDGEYYQVFTFAVHNGDVLSYGSGNYIGQAPYASLYQPSMFVNFDGPTNDANFTSSYSEDGLTFTSPSHLHFENDMDADGNNELGGHNFGTEIIEITKTGGGTFSLIGMDTAAGPFGQNDQVEWIAYRLVGAVYVESGRMVISPGGHITFTSAFLNIDKVVWNSAYSDNGGMAVDNIEYRAASSNVAPGTPTDSDATGDGIGVAATITEDHAVGTSIGITASAADGNSDTLSYSFGFDINGDPLLTSGAFTIDASTGIVTLSSAVDFETQSSHTLTIYATDPDGLSSQADFVVDVTNVAPDAPADADSTGDGPGLSATVAEDLAVGSLIGLTANAIDGDGDGSPISYSFGLDGFGDPILASGLFAIDPSTGVVTLASVLNYETAASHILRIYASDGTDSSYTDFTVAVTNVAPDAPSDIDAAGNTLAENAANNTYTGVTAAATDVNGGTVTYIMTGDAGGRFKVDASTGQILATGTGNLDYETAPFSDINGRYYQVAVQASDGTDQSAASTFKIYVTNVVEHLFTPGNDGSAAAPINFNTLPDGAYDPDGAQYNALAGNDYVYLPNTGAVDAGNPWDYNRTFDAGDGNDVVQGGNGNDNVSGGAGNDALFGGVGDDRLVGASGDDILGGGDGADKLTGSSGKDIFVFTDSEIGTAKLGEHDVITDFQQGTDKVDLSALYDNGVVFGGLLNGKLSNTTSSANKVGYYTEGGKTWIQGDVTGDGRADFSIELSGSYKLKGTDLVVGSSTIASVAQWSTATGGLAYSPYHHDDYFL